MSAEPDRSGYAVNFLGDIVQICYMTRNRKRTKDGLLRIGDRLRLEGHWSALHRASSNERPKTTRLNLGRKAPRGGR